MRYTVVLTVDEEEPGILNVSVPSLLGCHTWGRSKREALRNAKEAIACYLESLEAAGDPVPVESSSHVVVVQ